MNDSNLAFLTLSDLAEMRKQQKISALEITQFYLHQIERYQSDSYAFISIYREQAENQAKDIDSGSASSSPLSGLPYSVKDLIDVGNEITTAGSSVLDDNRADQDAWVVSKMRQAGAICCGKNNLHEFAYGATGENLLYGTARNPYDARRLAGGSSSGSAAAVGWGMVPAAFGTDTGGSVRGPAALCGLVGFKPTLGRISTAGVLPYCWTLDHVGTITRSVRDAALLLETVAGHDPTDPSSSQVPCSDYSISLPMSLKGIRIGLAKRFFFERVDPEIQSATQSVIDYLKTQGVVFVEVELPDLEYARTVSLSVQMPEALSFHMRYLEDRADRYSLDFRAGLALGQNILAEHYIRASRMISFYRQQMGAIFNRVDFLITPGAPIIAPKVGTVAITEFGQKEALGNAITRFTSFFNMTGNPAITLPSGLHSSGLPMSVQIIGNNFEESAVLNLAHAVSEVGKFQIEPPQTPGVLPCN
ncbi:MAG: aspartyl-tRNA(Asn)/glutamyl-tRNA(Gln) amidotransferase subunit A [Gammaproteobacteria bacterium]|jgi:aspartyl-tRNA(Asn)/glutamyl-tRNA(Gln) amidotransferase subunit A